MLRSELGCVSQVFYYGESQGGRGGWRWGGGKGSPTVSGSLLLHQRPTDVVLKVLRGGIVRDSIFYSDCIWKIIK